MAEILYKIEYLRNKMHETINEKSISHPEVLAVSQKLDKALNEFYQAD